VHQAPSKAMQCTTQIEKSTSSLIETGHPLHWNGAFTSSFDDYPGPRTQSHHRPVQGRMLTLKTIPNLDARRYSCARQLQALSPYNAILTFKVYNF
jgi:hypothetical protein